MGAPIIFAGNSAKLLKAELDFFGQSKIISGTVDPSMTATSGNPGSLYLNTSTGRVYRKTDSGSTTNWVFDFIADGSVTNAKLANMAESTIKGRAASTGTGVPVDLTSAQATAILDNMVGDSGSGGTKGLVPAPSTGDAAKVLSGAGTWVSALTNPMTSIGDLIIGSTAGAPDRLAIGSNGTRLQVVSGAPAWFTPSTPTIDNTDSPFTCEWDSVVLCDCTSGDITVNLPTAIGFQGKQITIKKTAGAVANTVTIDGFSSQTIDGSLTYELFHINDFITITSDGTNCYIVSKNEQPVRFLGYGTGDAWNSGTTYNFDFDTLVQDNFSLGSIGGEAITIPRTGLYQISHFVRSDSVASSSLNRSVEVNLNVNAAQVLRMTQVFAETLSATRRNANSSVSYFLNKNDVVKIDVLSTWDNNTTVAEFYFGVAELR